MPPAVRGRRSSRLRPCRFARRPGHDGPPSSRPASPRRRSSSVAWRPGCRDGCGQGADRSHRPASSWPGVLSPIRGMALGALRSFAFRAKRQQGGLTGCRKSPIQPTTCALPEAALLSCLPWLGPQRPTWFNPKLAICLSSVRWSAGPIIASPSRSPSARTGRRNSGRAPKDRRRDGRPGNDPAAL